MKIKILLGVLFFVCSTAANAMYVCKATSPTAYGYGKAYTLQDAQYIALNECSIRTPYNMACFIKRCWWE